MTSLRKQLLRYYRFCPHCGKKLRRKKIQGLPELICSSCGFIFWLNSKPTASVCMIDKKNRILLTRRAIAPHKGKLDLPGGFLLLNESPEKGARREILEELHIRLPKLIPLGVFTGTYNSVPPQGTINFYFFVKLKKNVKLSVHDDISDFTWRPLKEVNIRQVVFSGNRQAIHEAKKLL